MLFFILWYGSSSLWFRRTQSCIQVVIGGAEEAIRQGQGGVAGAAADASVRNIEQLRFCIGAVIDILIGKQER